MQEADITLSLDHPAAASASVYGTVTDGTDPIPNATAKLFDYQGIPFKHTVTNEIGEYSMGHIPTGTYSAAAVADGYLLSNAAGVTLSVSDTTQASLTCALDASLASGTISGTLNVMVKGVSTPLAGGKITLLNNLGATVASTYTADDGEFAFYDLADGVYSLLATAEGYLSTSPMTAAITKGSIVNIAMTMEIDSRTYNGTVSGIIRDSDGKAVAGCFVGLYLAATADTQETLIATTKTNSMGQYLFSGVTAGKYLVKAKMSR